MKVVEVDDGNMVVAWLDGTKSRTQTVSVALAMKQVSMVYTYVGFTELEIRIKFFKNVYPLKMVCITLYNVV